MDVAALEAAGLTKAEVAVYLALLETGSASSGKIVDKSDVSSSKIYEILDRLMKKGLASVMVANGVKHFEAAPPRRILDYLQEKEAALQAKKRDVEALLPELELRKDLARARAEATVFRGLKGADTAFRQMIDAMRPEDEWLGYVASFRSRRYSALLGKLHRYRAEKGLSARIIFSEAEHEDGEDRAKLKRTKIKYVPKSMSSPAVINTAGEYVLINIMADDVTVFLIRDRNAADSFRRHFEQLWDQEAFVVRGLDAIQDVFEDMLSYKGVDFIGAKGYFMDYRPAYIDRWEVEAKKRGFVMRNIVDQGVKGHRITRMPFAQTRYTLPKGFSELSVFWIYGEKVIISNWMQDEPTAIIIENKELHRMYERQFELLWNGQAQR